MSKYASLAISALLLASVAVGGSADDKPKSKGKKVETKKVAKLIEIKTCPITGETVKGEGTDSSFIGKYKVYYCCAGCKPSFEKMSKEEQTKKLDALAKKATK